MSVDQIHAFAFDDVPIRGRVVTLTNTWQKIRNRQTYAPDPERVLGEMVAIAAMLAQGIKLDGSVILQIRGNGPIRTAMAECTDRTMLRATLRTANNSSDATEATHSQHDEQLAITLKPHRGEMYQGIVPLDASFVRLDAASVPRAVEAYFDSSEQLPTRVWAAANTQAVAGLLLQRMPNPRGAPLELIDQIDESWRRVQLLADTVTDHELLTISADRLLRRLFHEEAVRLQPPTDLEFGCSCSRERTAYALRIMGRAEIDEILAVEGSIDVTCEFCGENFRYDPIDAQLLFEPLAQVVPETPH